MKPPTAAFLQKSQATLERAETMFRVDLYEDAGRTAYLAGYHVAQALIFEHIEKVMKTHRGVHSEFARIAKDDNRVDTELRAFLGRAYQLKSIADYEVGPIAEVTRSQAAQAIVEARRFIETIESLLASPRPA